MHASLTRCWIAAVAILTISVLTGSASAQDGAPAPPASEAPAVSAPQPAQTDQTGAPAPPEPPSDVTSDQAGPDGGNDGDVAANLDGTRLDQVMRFLGEGGPAIWAITALSVVTLALILWKIWHFFLAGAWSRKASFRAVAIWRDRQHETAAAMLASRRGVRSQLTRAAMEARLSLEETAAREEVSRVAKRELARLSEGLRALELIATIAPLLGLLGTVLGMIEAFQALQEAGNRADPALLAGGIWEALLTTAAGMAVAIPASVALTWFESVRDRVREDMEDIAARLFVQPVPSAMQVRQAVE